MQKLRGLSSVHLFALTLLSLPLLAGADTPGDLAFTDFPTANPSSLSNGQVLQARGGLINFQRGITAQSLYVIDAPVSAVQEKLATWNPASHRELKVWMHLPLPANPTAPDFASGLQKLPDNSSVKYLVNATQKLDPENPALQVSKEEASMIKGMAGSTPDARTLFSTVWSQILAQRSSRFLAGKFGSDRYETSSGAITSFSEIINLLRSDAKIYGRFHPLLAKTPVYNVKATPNNLYYESFDVEGGAVLGTGAMFISQPNGMPVPPNYGGTILVADIEYFLNNGIYVSLELHQLSPVVINGKNETLVWRADQVSTSNVAYLHGTERLASGMIMLQDVKQAVDAFRSEFK